MEVSELRGGQTALARGLLGKPGLAGRAALEGAKPLRIVAVHEGLGRPSPNQPAEGDQLAKGAERVHLAASASRQSQRCWGASTS
jgi:hypothetical protein